MALPFPTSYQKTVIYDLHVLRILGYVCNLYDVASDVASMEPDVLNMVFKDIDAVFITVDASSTTSLADADKWVKFLFKLNIPNDKTTLLVNKADTPSPILTQDTLDTFVALGGCSSWYWTVGHTKFSDYSPYRGRMENQEPPLDILICKVRNLISQRKRYSKSTEIAPALDMEVTKQAILTNRCKKYRSSYRTSNSIQDTRDKNSSDEGWDFFAGVLSRDEAHKILEDRIPGSFLLRRSDFNYGIRIVAKKENGTYAHIPIGKRNGRYIISVSNDSSNVHPSDSGGNTTNSICDTCMQDLLPSSPSLPAVTNQSKSYHHRRGNMYDTLLDVIESVGLNTIEGIRFAQRNR